MGDTLKNINVDKIYLKYFKYILSYNLWRYYLTYQMLIFFLLAINNNLHLDSFSFLWLKHNNLQSMAIVYNFGAATFYVAYSLFGFGR